MQLWLERYALPLCAAAVFGLCALNPLKLTPCQRWGTALAITALSLVIAYVIYRLKVKDRRKRAEIRGKLSAFLSAGQDLIQDCYDNRIPIAKDGAKQWAAGTEEYLNGLGSEYVVRFHNAAGVPIEMWSVYDPDGNVLLRWLHIRCFRLNEFIAEIRD